MALSNRAVWRNKWKGRQEPVNAFARSLVRRLGPGRGRTLLDVGCGNGVDSLFFAKRGYAVAATDFSESGIHALRTSAQAEGLSIDTHLHDTAETFPFKSGTFDVIYAHLSLHYFDDATTQNVFAEMRRLLKNGGYIFVKCKSTKDCQYGIGERIGPDMYRDGHIRHFFTPAYLRRVLRDVTILSERSSSAQYHGKTSAFVQAVGRA